MAQNTSPIFTKTPHIDSVPITAVNTRSDGNGTIGTDIFKAFTAGVDGSFVNKVRLTPTATSAATATAATVIRIFISTKTSGATTSADTFLIQEVACGSQTADATTNATFPIEVPLNITLPASYTILVTTHVTNAANTAWQATVFGGDY